MKKTRFTEEQIIAALRDAEATTVVAAARKHGVSEQSIHRWRKQFAGMSVSMCGSFAGSVTRTGA